ncbi:glycosyltransferase family 4 protein [Neobacillus drentensis]|uniref:glycosyltransferase family 4 protein n=1 Tax=Neobacillus drentensis TaxID=220684 RepID=UPI00285AB441|nr:glycosyltransferase family 1 protein [Neobacillus drentensis]MDR7237682.1 glycosyltransferase involved in cell wall biosynthesis [Neobacillus drentensis]
MRIAIFTDTYDPDINGVARTLKYFIHYLENKNISYKVFAPDSLSNESVSSNVCRVKSLSFFLYPDCRLAFPNLSRIKSELEEFSPDIIHVATPFNMGLCGVYLAKKLTIPLVGSYHTDFDHYLKFYDLRFFSKILWKYMNWFHKPFKKLFVPSNETLNQLKCQGFVNLEVWPGGVDCQLFHPYYEKQVIREQWGISKKYLLTYVGRLAPEKDLKTLLAVAKTLPAEINEEVQWFVIGDGPQREELQIEAPANMTLTGYLTGEQLAEIYSASDLFVFPSPTETFGNVVIEALASGTPAITANSGGVKNIIKAGVTGYLCETGNVMEFTNAILKLLENDDLRKQLGIEGRNYALTQSWDKIFYHLLWHYRAVIDEPNIQKYA